MSSKDTPAEDWKPAREELLRLAEECAAVHVDAKLALREKQARLLQLLQGGRAGATPQPRAEPADPNPQQPLVDGNIEWFRRQGLMPDAPDDGKQS